MPTIPTFFVRFDCGRGRGGVEGWGGGWVWVVRVVSTEWCNGGEREEEGALGVEEHLLVALALVGGQVAPVALGAALLEELLDLALGASRRLGVSRKSEGEQRQQKERPHIEMRGR